MYFRRADGLVYLVTSDARIYEMRPVGLTQAVLERAADAGLLTRHDDPASEVAPPRQSPERRRWSRVKALRLA